MYTNAAASYKKIVLFNDSQATCVVEFDSFWSNNCSFSYGGSKINLQPHSILLKKIEITKGNYQIGDIDFDWKMVGTIKLENNIGMTKMFTIKGGSLMKKSYELHDLLTNHLLTITPQWNWSRFNYDYMLTIGKDVADDENNMDNDLLAIVALYASYLISKKRRRRRNA